MTEQEKQIASLQALVETLQGQIGKLHGEIARLQAAAPIQSGELLAPLLADTSPLYAWIGENGIGAAEYKRRCAAIDVIKAVAGNAVARPTPDADLMPKRAAFIAWCESRGIETAEDKDAWGKRKFRHSHVEAMWDGWFNAPVAAPIQAASALEGWQLVPTDPTNKMTFVGQSMRHDTVNSIGSIYCAMLAAAPAAPQAAQELTDAEIEALWQELPGIKIHNEAARNGVDTRYALRLAHARAIIAHLTAKKGAQ